MTAGFQQLINGHAWDFSSVQITVSTPAPKFITRIASINYEQSLTPGQLRGNSAQVLALTRGQYEASGSMSLYREEYNLLIAALALAPFPPPPAGYMQKSFEIIVNYGELDSIPSVDTLSGCRITRDSSQNQQGGDSLMVDLDFIIIRMLKNGLLPVADRGGII